MRCKANNRIYLQIYGVIIPLFMGLNGFGFAGVLRRKGGRLLKKRGGQRDKFGGFGGNFTRKGLTILSCI